MSQLENKMLLLWLWELLQSKRAHL